MKICCVWDHVTSWQHFQVEYVGITADTSEADVVLWTCAVPLVVLCLYCVPSSKHVFFFSTKEDGHPRKGFIYVYCVQLYNIVYIYNFHIIYQFINSSHS